MCIRDSFQVEEHEGGGHAELPQEMANDDGAVPEGFGEVAFENREGRQPEGGGEQ